MGSLWPFPKKTTMRGSDQDTAQDHASVAPRRDSRLETPASAPPAQLFPRGRYLRKDLTEQQAASTIRADRNALRLTKGPNIEWGLRLRRGEAAFTQPDQTQASEGRRAGRGDEAQGWLGRVRKEGVVSGKGRASGPEMDWGGHAGKVDG